MSVEIKKVQTKKELEEVYKLDLALLRYEAEVDSSLRKPNDKIKRYEKRFLDQKFKDKNSLILIARDNGKPIGYCLGSIQKLDPNHKVNPEGYIFNIFVLDGYRRNGVGKKLIRAMIDWFKEKNIKRIVVDVTEKNKAGLAFFEKLGFRLHPFRRLCLDV
jgi:ribosomal protein S18 acetylase RimI-like enzyme